MGLSSSKQKTTPVYSAELKGAAGNISNAYNAQAPKLTAVTDSLGSLASGLVERYTQGDSGINAARGYDASVLSGKYLDAGNPHLESIVTKAGNDARNETAGALGTRGLTGGSAFADIISRNVANAGNQLRYADYNAERTRMDSAASRAPGLAAAQYLPLQSLIDVATAQSAPIQAAVGAGSGIGGLLGQYTNTKQKGSIGQLIAQLAGNTTSAFAAGA